MSSRDTDDPDQPDRRILFGLLIAGLAVVVYGAAASAGYVPFDLQTDDDEDGLEDSRERALGTNPEDPDTDGDRLRDGWEVDNRTGDGLALPGSDPLHKDLYVQFNYGKRIPKLTTEERRQLRETWANMSVKNPDGEPGVRIHVTDQPPKGGHLGRVVRIVDNDSKRDLGSMLRERYYEPADLGKRYCVYHRVILGEFDAGATVGFGDTPGYLSVVDGTQVRNRGSNVSIRLRYVMHELLHNVVGHFDDGTDHTEDGWLSHRAVNVGANQYLSRKTLAELNENGFARSEQYSELCE